VQLRCLDGGLHVGVILTGPPGPSQHTRLHSPSLMLYVITISIGGCDVFDDEVLVEVVGAAGGTGLVILC